MSEHITLTVDRHWTDENSGTRITQTETATFGPNQLDAMYDEVLVHIVRTLIARTEIDDE